MHGLHLPCFSKPQSLHRPLTHFVPVLALALAACGTFDSSKQDEPRPGLSNLRITEINYHALDQDTISGDEYEFVELLNTGDLDLDLAQVGFTEGITFTFTAGDKLGPEKYLVLAANPLRFKERYGFNPFGTYTGKLSNSGERITLKDLRADTVLAAVEFSDLAPWPVRADGVGSTLVPLTAAGTAAEATAWKASFANHGSPGKADPQAVLVNEVSTHTDPPERDAIELFNPNAEPVDLGGWYLSDEEMDPAKFRIPAGKTIPAGGYLVFYADDFNADSTASTAFSLSAHGDEVYLSTDASGCAGFCHGFSYGEIENGFSFGRYLDNRGQEHFVEQKTKTLGAANSGPKVGSLVISEIMYHPANDTDEYLELVNISGDSLPLFDPNFPENTWKVKGLAFTFPVHVTLAKNEVVLILSTSAPEDSFRTAHAIPASVRIFTASGHLSNGGDTLSLMQPQEPYDDGAGLVVPYKLVEKVEYLDGGAWPGSPDGTGNALTRKELTAFANDPSVWKGEPPSPGRLSP